MRQLYIVDAVGATFYFDEREGVLLSNLNGLGFDRTNVYLKYSDRYQLIENDTSVSQISATITFFNKYEGYTHFINYLKKSQGDLRLFYSADNLKYCYIAFKGITKTELTYNSLSSTITLERLSYWLYKQNYTITVNENTCNKVYPYTYSFDYSISFNGEITVNNNGFNDAQARIEMLGLVNNPTIEIIKDNIVLQTLRLFIKTTSANDKIIIDATSTALEMTLITSNEEVNIYPNQDFSCKNFLTIPKGSYIVKFNPGVSEKTSCKVSYVESYEGN